jgi:histidyl-tRNA synthetase
MVERLRGFRDFYPEEQEIRSEMFSIMKEACRQFGFKEIDGPSVESVELFANKSGMEIMNQMFSFKDKGGRDVTLIPEFTPTLARMVSSRKDLVKPLKWFSVGKFWRYEEPQSGRFREFYQLNADILGSESYLADAEVASLAAFILRRLDIGKDTKIKISSRILIDTLIQTSLRGKKESAYYLLDRWTKMTPEERDSFIRENGIDADTITSFSNGKILEGLENPELLRLNAISDYIRSSVGVNVEIDLKIVRGLAYYTGFVFEATDRDEKFRSILGGGRYDNIVEQLGGESTPSVGFAAGDAVLENVLKIKGKWTQKEVVRVFIASVDPPGRAYAIKVAPVMRDLGLDVDVNVTDRGISKQLDYASKLGYEHVVILGENESKKQTLTVKTMSTGQQKEIELKDVKDFFTFPK